MIFEQKGIKVNDLLAGILLAGLTTIFLPSCTHESLVVVDPTPIDATGNPVDTTGNPDISTGTPCDPNVVYFSSDILPLLVSYCAKSGCHDAASHREGIVTDNFQNIMASRLVKAYDVNKSKLISVIKSNSSENGMPPAPALKLNAAQIALISKWILGGAKDLTCDGTAGQCVTTNITYSGFVAPLLTTYCVGCHSGGVPSGGISLTTLASVKAVALSGKLYGSINWTAGFQKMPKGTSKLSQCNIDKIKGWIDDGAPNN